MNKYTKDDIPFLIGTDVSVIDSNANLSHYEFHIIGDIDGLLYGERLDKKRINIVPRFIMYTRIVKAPFLDTLKLTPLFKLLTT